LRKLKFFGVLFFSSIVLSACSNPFDQLADEINSWLGSESGTSDETEVIEDNMTTEETNTREENGEEAVEKLDYSHLMNQGTEVTVEEGLYDVGSDIEPGRYIMTADTGYGSIYIQDDEDKAVTSDNLAGDGEGYEDKIKNIVIFLDEDYSIEISGLENVTLTPYETSSVNTIFPGQWVAGEDFPAGVYDISLEESESYGTLEVYEIADMNKSRHSLGSEAYGGMTEFTMSFEEGDIVELKYIPEVTLTER